MQDKKTFVYQAFLATLLNYCTAELGDAPDPTLTGANANLGLKTQYEFSKESEIIEMFASIFSAVFFHRTLPGKFL